MIELRPYQLDLIERCRVAYRSGKRRVCLQAPTGGGKTVIFSFVSKSAVSKKLHVLVLAHRSEILDQIEATLRKVGVPAGIVRANQHNPCLNGVTVASVQTLVRRFDRVPTPDLVIVDECHHAVAGTWAEVFAQYPKANFLGVTATPERLDGRGLGEMFDELIVGPSVQQLMDQKFLATPRYFAPANTPDFSNVKISMGEFNRQQMAEMMDKPTITGDAVEHYRKHLNGRTAVAFCISIEHADHVAAAFNQVGISSAVIDGTMKPDQRRSLVEDLAAGRLKVMTSCELISEGFDLPSVNGAILLRPTASLALHLQQIGRCLRPKPDGSNAIILDHVGNIARHGPAEEPRDWSLDSRKRKPRQPNEEQKTCKQCFCVYIGNQCPNCGNQPKGEAREIECVHGELSEDAAAEIIAKRRADREVAMAGSYEELQKIGKARGYKPGWAWHRWKNSRKNHERKPSPSQHPLPIGVSPFDSHLS